MGHRYLTCYLAGARIQFTYRVACSQIMCGVCVCVCVWGGGGGAFILLNCGVVIVANKTLNSLYVYIHVDCVLCKLTNQSDQFAYYSISPGSSPQSPSSLVHVLTMEESESALIIIVVLTLQLSVSRLLYMDCTSANALSTLFDWNVWRSVALVGKTHWPHPFDMLIRPYNLYRINYYLHTIPGGIISFLQLEQTLAA